MAPPQPQPTDAPSPLKNPFRSRTPPLNASIDPDLLALGNNPGSAPSSISPRPTTPQQAQTNTFALDDIEKTPPPFFNSLPALANLSSSPVLLQGAGWGTSTGVGGEDGEGEGAGLSGSGALSGSEERRRMREQEARKVMKRDEVEQALDARSAAQQGDLLVRLAEHALALEDLHSLERQSSDRNLSSLKSQYSALALTHQSTLDRLALKDAEISSLKAQAAVLYTKASSRPSLSHPSSSTSPYLGGGPSAFTSSGGYAREAPASPARGADVKPNGAQNHLYGDYAPPFQPYLERARDEEAYERLEGEKRGLQSDKKYLRRRLHNADAQVRTLTGELKRLRHHLLSSAPIIIPRPEERREQEKIDEGPERGEEGGRVEVIDLDEHVGDDDEDDGPDYPYDGTPPQRRDLPLPPSTDDAPTPHPPQTSAFPSDPHHPTDSTHQRSHTFPQIASPSRKPHRSHRTHHRKHASGGAGPKKRRPTMGDAEAEHLLLASRALASVVRPIPRPSEDAIARGEDALTPLEAATYLQPPSMPTSSAVQGPSIAAKVEEQEKATEAEEEEDQLEDVNEEEEDDEKVVAEELVARRLAPGQNVRYGPPAGRRTSDVRGGLPSSSSFDYPSLPPASVVSPLSATPLPANTPGLIRPGKVPDAPPVKRGKHGASGSIGGLPPSSAGGGVGGQGGQAGIFAQPVLPQTPRSSGQGVAVGSPTRSGGIEDLLAAAQTVLTRSTSPTIAASGGAGVRKRSVAAQGNEGKGAKRRRVIDEGEGEATPRQTGAKGAKRKESAGGSGGRSSSAPLPGTLLSGASEEDDEDEDDGEAERTHQMLQKYPSALDVLADQAFASASASQSSQESTYSPPRHHTYVPQQASPSSAARWQQQQRPSGYPSVLLPAPHLGGSPTTPRAAAHHHELVYHQQHQQGVNGQYAHRPPAPAPMPAHPSYLAYHNQHPQAPSPQAELAAPEMTPAAAAAKKARSPYVKWTFQEDELLVRAVCEHGQRWDAVSKCVPSRSYHQCRQRWLRGLKSGENLPDGLQHYYPAVKVALRAHANMRTQQGTSGPAGGTASSASAASPSKTVPQSPQQHQRGQQGRSFVDSAGGRRQPEVSPSDEEDE